jgi:hypothetical protein
MDRFLSPMDQQQTQIEASATPTRVEFRQVFDDRLFPLVEADIEAALERSSGRMTAEDVFTDVSRGTKQLWLGADTKINVVVVTEVIQWPRKRALSIVLATGKDRDDWLQHMDTLEDFARSHDCDFLETWARPGWEKILGWKKTHVLLEKRLEHVEK